MGETTQIQWTEATYNPWHGCKKVSPGCKNCYMYRDKERYGQDPMKVVRSGPATFNAPLKWKEQKLIFTCSWSDFFIPEADQWRDEAWEIIRHTPQHTYQILTKRPERIKDHLPEDWGSGWPNVWLGTSVENQEYADKRIPELLKIPAAVHFLSCEPLLGLVELRSTPVGQLAKTVRTWLTFTQRIGDDKFNYATYNRIDWIIAGGESGPKFRPVKEEWLTSLRDQCERANVPFFFKQWAGVNPHKLGRLLEGREWNEMPEAETIETKQMSLF